MKIAQLVIEGEEIRKIVEALYNNDGVTHTDKPYMYSSGDVVVLMRECFYMRISSTLMSVIIMKFINDNKVEIELVVSGGKEGMLMLSWGSENSENRSIVQEIMNLCNSNSWEITSINPEDLKESFAKSTVNKFKDKFIKPFKK